MPHSKVCRAYRQADAPSVSQQQQRSPSSLQERLGSHASNGSGSPTAASNGSNGSGGIKAVGIGSIKLTYRTTWDRAWAHGSVNGGPWLDMPLSKVSSAPGRWLSGSVEVPAAAATAGKPLYEFVVRSANNEYDKAPEGRNYRIDTPGRYILRDGQLRASTVRPVMVVSDLDGTMIGEDDAATGTFRKWWEEEGAARGGVLVYNTGRALQSFLQLLREKGHCLAHPDALISAVGTKVYECDGGKWKGDIAYSALLNEDWDLGAVRDTGYKTLAVVGKESMHFRPPEEQNVHKVTVGVATRVLQRALEGLAEGLSAAGVQANVIVSGAGDWRFVDIVPLKAGKLEALNYVRQRYGFPVDSTVACGDSGNDILMLSGANPGIVVGNAQPDLRTWLASRADEPPQPDGKTRLHQARAHEAWGILEGLQYFGFK